LVRRAVPTNKHKLHPTRREFLRWSLGLLAGGVLAACGMQARNETTGSATSLPTKPAPPTQTLQEQPLQPTPACVVRPEQTEGPYFVDEMLNRSDIRSDSSDGSVKEGVPLRLVFNVSQIDGSSCTPLAGAFVDVWQCDALGVYSDVQDPGFDTTGEKFLRGYQVTDVNGAAEFMTIYPGWYQGRTVHIHFKVRADPASQQGYEFTSQLYFDDSITDQVHAREPYAAKGQRTLKNDGDGIFQNGGSQLMPQLAEEGEGYVATFNIGLQVS
jgi:protocatechuate 3,4-dioxygenase beta subunit